MTHEQSMENTKAECSELARQKETTATVGELVQSKGETEQAGDGHSLMKTADTHGQSCMSRMMFQQSVSCVRFPG
jgi:hypothetical protein